MTGREWKPGDVAMVTWRALGKERTDLRFRTDDDRGPRWIGCDGSWIGDFTAKDARPLVVIDPEDREQVERFMRAYWRAYGSERVMESRISRLLPTAQAALREFANPAPPKPYRTVASAVAPWPQVGECHSSHVADHECPQCAWPHEHDWVAWTGAGDSYVHGVPIRCAKCGGRKCDQDDCGLQRHTHTHADGGAA